jgi:hypothetical protein
MSIKNPELVDGLLQLAIYQPPNISSQLLEQFPKFAGDFYCLLYHHLYYYVDDSCTLVLAIMYTTCINSCIQSWSYWTLCLEDSNHKSKHWTTLIWVNDSIIIWIVLIGDDHHKIIRYLHCNIRGMPT